MELSEFTTGIYVTIRKGHCDIHGNAAGVPHEVTPEDYNLFGYYEPIPLTDEWFDKFQFKYYKVADMQSFELGRLHINKSNMNQYYCYIGNEAFFFSYVHQLQIFCRGINMELEEKN